MTRRMQGHDLAPVHAKLAREARAELDRIIAWWAAKTPDKSGGFVGEIDAAGAVRTNADKAVVLNTRLLWFFSEAYARTRLTACLDLAARAADYVSEKFVDANNGGLFWMLDAKGRQLDRRKQAYAQAFGVYAFAAHFSATNDEASLKQALALFDVLETHYLDSVNDGYCEALAEDFAPIVDMRLSPRDLNAPKGMNTHLHTLEAYTKLYKIQRGQRIATALRRTLRVMLDHIVDPKTGHLRLFFDGQWRSLDQTVSFGHDIEASWLICEAADALGDAALSQRSQEAALRLAGTTLAEAIGPNGEIFEERDAHGHVSQKRVWWIQAEGLVGFLNAFALTSEPRYLDAAERLWRFIQMHQIDGNGGEWRSTSALDAPSDPPEPQAGPWKCPYHTGRAMMEVERRASALARGLAENNKMEMRT
jgi:cellobiose epimerase